MSVVEMSDTGVEPGAVMVHLHHTPGTPAAVVRPRGLVALTLRAELELRAGRGVPRTPVRREEAGPNTESTEEMVYSQTGETCSKTEVRGGRGRGEGRLTTKYEGVDETPETL